MNSRGMSVTGVLVAVGLFGALAAGLMSLMETMSQSHSTSRYKNELEVLNQELRGNLSNRNACRNSFAGALLNASTNQEFAEIKKADNTVFLNKVADAGDHTLKVKSFLLRRYVDEVAPSGVAELFVRYEAKGSVYGGKEIARVIRLRTTKDAGNLLTECFALGSDSDDLWKISPINPNNIYYQGGNVGVDLDNPLVKLHVQSNENRSSFAISRRDDATEQASAVFVSSVTNVANPAWAIGLGANSPNFFINSSVDGVTADTRLTIDSRGHVGIGTASPLSLVHVYSSGSSPRFAVHNPEELSVFFELAGTGGVGSSSAEGFEIEYSNHGDTFFRNRYKNPALNHGNMYFNVDTAVASKTALMLKYDASVGVGTTNPTEKLHIVGNVRVQGASDCTVGTGSGGLVCASDVRLKDNIRSLENPLTKISSISGVEFIWNEKSQSPGQHAIGVIAQDVEKVFPTAVFNDSGSGFKKVDYAALVAPIIEAIKELVTQTKDSDENLQSQIDDLRKSMQVVASENNDLRLENRTLLKRLNSLEDKFRSRK